MKDTANLNGTFTRMQGDDKSGTVYMELIMNQKVVELPLEYTIEGNKINMKGKMMLMEWDIQEAFDSLHKACELLHTGEDGISKTWDEVLIESVSYVDEK